MLSLQLFKEIRERIRKLLCLTPPGEDRRRDGFVARALRFLYSIGKVFLRDECFSRGAALAYITILSIFPLVATLLFLVPVFFSAGEIQKVQGDVGKFIFSFIIPDSGNAFDARLQEYFTIYKEKAPGIGAVGLVVTFVAAVVLFYIVEGAFNLIWKVKKRRHILKSFMIFTGVIVWIPILIGLSLFYTRKYSWMAPGGVAFHLQLLPFVMGFLGLFFAYYYIPNTNVRPLCAAIGAFIGAILWQIAKRTFGPIISHFATYTNLFQSAGAIPFFLVWLYVSWLIILFGIIISYCAQNLNALMIEDLSRSIDIIDPAVVLILLYVIGDYFEKGKGSVLFSDIRNACPIGARDLANHLAYLEEENLISCNTSEDSYILKKPSDKIFLREILSLKKRTQKLLYYDGSARDVFFDEMHRIDATLKDVLRDHSLGSLLRQVYGGGNPPR